MKALVPDLLGTAALLATAPLAARSPTHEQIVVMDGVSAFFTALRSDDKTALARQMLPEGVIFVHNRMKPDAPRVDVVPVADHLARWATQTRTVYEAMDMAEVLVTGDMAQVWGPYYFEVEGRLSHCGINSLSMVKTAEGWKVANTSFTMEAPERCAEIVRQVDAVSRREP
jgi:ketosteroid isomerase-like protein